MIKRNENSIRSGCVNPSTPQKHLSISNVPVDVRCKRTGDRIGSKCPAEIEVTVGGLGRHAGLAANANGIESGVIGVQATQLASLCRQLLDGEGIRPHIVERLARPGAITVATPNGKPGQFDLDVQPMSPLTEREVSDVVSTTCLGPSSVFMGPMQVAADCRSLHQRVAGLAHRRALMVHPSLLYNQSLFSEVGRLYEYVQMNLNEASVLDPATDDIDLLACRVRYLLRDRVTFAITNGPDRGLLWCAENRKWFVIQPPVVDVVRGDIGSDDLFGASFNFSRWYFGATVKEALAYARAAVGAWLSGKPLPAY